MGDMLTDLRETFETAGYEVGDVRQNRAQVRIVLLEEGAAATDLRPLVNDVLDEEEIIGLNITSESVEGQDGMNTVVTFRMRG